MGIEFPLALYFSHLVLKWYLASLNLVHSLFWGLSDTVPRSKESLWSSSLGLVVDYPYDITLWKLYIGTFSYLKREQFLNLWLILTSASHRLSLECHLREINFFAVVHVCANESCFWSSVLQHYSWPSVFHVVFGKAAENGAIPKWGFRSVIARSSVDCGIWCQQTSLDFHRLKCENESTYMHRPIFMIGRVISVANSMTLLDTGLVRSISIHRSMRKIFTVVGKLLWPLRLRATTEQHIFESGEPKDHWMVSTWWQHSTKKYTKLPKMPCQDPLSHAIYKFIQMRLGDTLPQI